MLTVQFSSGCPYLCEFCDIPGLYGRQPRLKTPQQITAELDAMRKQKGHPPVVYFVDDNFVGNRKAAKDMLPVLVEWQKQHGYPLQFACEATLNIAKQTEILELMREASFLGLFVGIETPEADALKAMRKDQNNAVPMMASIKTLNDYGLEVTSGIILGLDTDSDDTESRLKDFIDLSQIPMLTINLLQALPKTPLWDRLEKADRLGGRSGARKQRALPAALRRGGRDVAALHRLCQRSRAAVRALPPSGRLDLREPDDPARQGQAQLVEPVGARRCWRSASFWHIGVRSDYRKPFWRAARHAMKRGQIDAVLGMGFIAHHLIQFTREALRGEQNASYYSTKTRERDGAEPRHGSRRAGAAAQVGIAPNSLVPAERARRVRAKWVPAARASSGTARLASPDADRSAGASEAGISEH